MMNACIRRSWMAILLAAGLGTANAASLPGSASRDALVKAERLQRLSVGAGYELLDREITLDGGIASRLEADTYLGYAGFDLLSWLTLFGEGGSSDVTHEEAFVGGAIGDDAYWSVGILVNLWNYMLRKPEAWTGLLSIRLVGQVAEYNGSGDGFTIDWQEASITLPVAYEIYADPDDHLRNVHSLVLSAGPTYSTLDGDLEGPGYTTGFSENNNVGFFGAADVFVYDNFSLGAKIQIFDETSYAFRGLLHF